MTENIWTTSGPEFGSESDKQYIIVWEFYGLKPAGSAFINHLYQCMSELGYSSCKLDPDVWIIGCTKTNGTGFNEYILFYFENILCISNKPREVIAGINKFFPIQPGLIAKTDICIGAKVSITVP